jgi:hypothetical protein
MGLDTTHNAWHGAYSSFHSWRVEVAKQAGFPPLEMMAGFGGIRSWDDYLDHPLYELLSHSDCDGDIKWETCKIVADGLSEILDKMPDEYGYSLRKKTKQFIDGLMLAYNSKENLEFH